MDAKEKKVWTKEEVRENLMSNQEWLERGILAIFRQQTADEQSGEYTRWYNRHGFSSADASYLTYTANWLLSGKHLTGYHVEKARRRLLKYAGQLAKIANGTLEDDKPVKPAVQIAENTTRPKVAKVEEGVWA